MFWWKYCWIFKWICVQTVPADGITTLYRGRNDWAWYCVYFLSTCVCTCVRPAAQIILTSVQIRMQTPVSSRMTLQDPNISPIPIIPCWHAVSQWQFASRKSDMDSCINFVLQSGRVNILATLNAAFRPHSDSFPSKHLTLNVTFRSLNVINRGGWENTSLLEPH